MTSLDIKFDLNVFTSNESISALNIWYEQNSKNVIRNSANR